MTKNLRPRIVDFALYILIGCVIGFLVLTGADRHWPISSGLIRLLLYTAVIFGYSAHFAISFGTNWRFWVIFILMLSIHLGIGISFQRFTYALPFGIPAIVAILETPVLAFILMVAAQSTSWKDIFTLKLATQNLRSKDP